MVLFALKAHLSSCVRTIEGTYHDRATLLTSNKTSNGSMNILKIVLLLLAPVCLWSCAGGGEDDASRFNGATAGSIIPPLPSDNGNKVISPETVKEISRSYAPWEPEQEILGETRNFINWLNHRKVPLPDIRQIVNWTQFELEFSALTDPCFRTTCYRADLLNGYYTGLAGAVIDSKRKGRETITPSPMAGDGMLVADTIDLMHSYYLESGIWSDPEYKLIESLRSKFEKIEVVPGNLSMTLDAGILRICQLTTDQQTHEVDGPCTTIHIE